MGIECDIQRSRDGSPMVFHDWELDRLTDFSGATDGYSKAALEEIHLVGGANRIPTLRTLLQQISGVVPLLIEIKSKPNYAVEPSCLGVYEELKAYDGDCAVMSFDPQVCEWFRAHAPDVVCGLVMREDQYGYTQTPEARQSSLDQATPDFLAYHVAALPNPWVEGLRASGLPILTWTVNSALTRETALKCADALICEREGIR